jgi:DNA-binding MarR family transcriptional regulator
MMGSPPSPQTEAEMTTPTDPLVEALAARLHRADLVAWQRIAAWAEGRELSFEDLRLLLALMTEDGPAGVSELAGLAGLPLDTAYPAIHALRGRGYLLEDRRQYSLSDDGQELVAALEAAHHEGIQAYVDDMDPDERRQIEEALGITR